MKQIFYTFILLVAFALSPNSIWGQRTVGGTLTDADSGDPLIGANILVVGTNTGTISDIDGSYSIQIPENGTQLIFSYTGYADQTINIGTSNIIDLQMTAGSILDEVVVIGYGTVKREDLTGSIQTVDSKVFNKGAITSPQQLLAGKIAGVQITSNSGAPGEGSTIRIRGGSSLTAKNDPLIVIDGIPIDNDVISGTRNTLNVINPNDIETFTVLKDASATAIYGSRASNGVILITTKKGKLGTKTRVTYSGNVSFSNIIDKFDVFSPSEYRTLIEEQYPEGSSQRAALGTESTDWQDEIFESATGTDHNLSISGGIAEVLPYRFSAGYTKQKGILKTDEFQRTTGSLNLSPGFLDNQLQVNVNLKGTRIENRFADRGAIGNATRFDPTQPVFSGNDDVFGGYFTYIIEDTVNNLITPNRLSPLNPRALLEQKKDVSEVNRMVVSTTVDYRMPFLPELRANLNLGYDYSKGMGTINVPTTAAVNFNEVNGGGVDNEYEQTKKNKLLEFYLNYSKKLGNSNLEVMGGYSWQHFFIRDFSLNSNVAGTPSETVEKDQPRERYLVSLFGRLNYTLADRYILTATLRRDGSSRFSPDARWGLFPAAALAVKVLDDKEGVLNNLKLRVGYGVTGQEDFGNDHLRADFYAYQSLYTAGLENAQYQFGNTFVNTLRPEEYDGNIKWEETTTYNFAVDFGLFDDRVFGTVEYYTRETKDLLNRIPIPAGTNLSNFITTNVGNLENKGIEVSLNVVPVQTQDLSWEVGLNATRNENKITKLTATDDESYQGVLVGGISGGVGSNIQIHSVGFPAYSFYVFEQVYDDNGTPIEGLFVDRNKDGVINNQDQYRYKNAAPEYFFGLTSTLNYKNLSFSFAGRANMGGYVYNNVQSDQAYYSRLVDNGGSLNNVVTAIEDIQFENPQYFSDYFVQDGSFFRLDHVTLSYTLNNLFDKVSALTLSATLQNPLLISDYQGIDPEIGSGDKPGIDNNIYPRTRTFVFGLSASF